MIEVPVNIENIECPLPVQNHQLFVNSVNEFLSSSGSQVTLNQIQIIPILFKIYLIWAFRVT